MNRYFIAFLVTLCISLISSAQTDSATTGGFAKEKVFVGGNFGLALGSYTLINISPQAGYRFNRFVGAGLGMNLIYTSQRFPGFKRKMGIAGLNTFGRVYPIRNALLQVQPELNYQFGTDVYTDGQKTKIDAEIIPSLLVGGGIVMPNPAGEFIILLMYDVMRNPRSHYGTQPVYNVVYNINLGKKK